MQLALCLVDEGNDFQQILRREAEEAARRSGVGLFVRWSGHDVAAQLNTIRSCLDERERPAAVLVLAVRDQGLLRVAQEAARAGVGFVWLNRTEDDQDALRREFPQLPIFTVCADELETGRIQGRQFRRLLPHGGSVVYVQGSRRSLAARDRTAGMEEATAGAGLDVSLVEGGWSEAEAREAVRSWLVVAARFGKRVDLVGGQNEHIALGARAAFLACAQELDRPFLADVPLTGCDGTETLGQRLVKEGTLKATVVLARSAGPAVEIAARALQRNQPPPALTLLKGRSFPAEESLVPLGDRSA
jgi:ABC-type sugar transport system substrate-binding protein